MIEKKYINKQPGKKALAKIFLILFGLILSALYIFSVQAADNNAVYSTVGGTWEKVNETTWTMDKDGDGKTDVTLIKEGDAWKYIFNVADDSSMYYGWEADIPDGYEVENGYGTKTNPAISIQYAHTSNIDNEGIQNGNYEGGIDTNKTFSVPGATSVNVNLTSSLADDDYIVIWEGKHEDYTAVDDADKGTKITGKIDSKDYVFNGDTITIGFHSEKEGDKGYGYYAAISSDKNSSGLTATNVSTEEPVLETGALSIEKKVLEPDGTESADDNIFKFNIVFTSDDEELSAMLDKKNTYGDVTIEHGKGTFYLSSLQKVTIKGIPAGISYKIEEEPNESYETSWTTDNGVIETEKEINIICTNKKKAEPEIQKESLTIKKQVKNNSNSNDIFSFHISFDNLEKNKEYGYSKGETGLAFSSDENGTADVAFELGDRESIVFNELPEGSKYKVTEDASNYYASYEITDFVNSAQQKQGNDQINQSLSTGTETIDADENATVIFTNTGKENITPDADKTKIHIEKVWDDNDNASGSRPENIIVYLMQDENVIKNITLNADNNWQADVDNLDIYHEDGKTKYVYSATEAPVSGYTAGITERENNNTTEFIITNTAVSTGKLKVSKTVEGNGAEEDRSFKFNIVLEKDGEPISGVYKLDSKEGSKTGTIAFDENGKSSFELKHNESIVISGLPAGANYTIKENSYKYYTASNDGEYSGTIDDESEAEINIINTHKEVYDLSVSKTVKGNQGDKTKKFEFTLTLNGESGIEVPSILEYKKGNETRTMNVVNGNVEFALSHGETIVFKDLPAGISYKIVENNAEDDGYIVESKKAEGTITSDTNASFINTKNVGIPTSAMTNTLIMFVIAMICGILLIRFWKKKKVQ